MKSSSHKEHKPAILEVLTHEEDIRYRNEAEYHESSVKSAIQDGAELELVQASVFWAPSTSKTIPEAVKKAIHLHLAGGYFVAMDCSLYSKPIALLQNEVDSFLGDTSSIIADQFLVWFFGRMKESEDDLMPVTEDVPRNLCTESCLPLWLEKFIYDANLAPNDANALRVQKNLLASKTDVLWYLGTYFPRSYGETFCIFDNIFERMKKADLLSKPKTLSILDVGCGSGGALIGLLWCIRKYRSDLQLINVVALDGNPFALETLSSVVDETKRQWNPGIKMVTHAVQIQNSFPTDIIRGQKFDVIITSKLLGELNCAETDVYQLFLDAYAPFLNETGVLMMLDVPTKNDDHGEFNPNRMMTSANSFIRSSGGKFKTILPLSCVRNGQSCQKGCFLKKKFVVQTKKKGRVESEVCYYVIMPADSADKMLAAIDLNRIGADTGNTPSCIAFDPAFHEYFIDTFCL